jgi:hypothetical protein
MEQYNMTDDETVMYRFEALFLANVFIFDELFDFHF